MEPLSTTPDAAHGRGQGSGILSRLAMAGSAEAGLENSAWIDGVFTVFRKAGPGLSFDLILGEAQAAHVVQGTEALAALPSEGGGASGEPTRVVARYFAGDAIPESLKVGTGAGEGNHGVWVPLADDVRLRDFVEKAARFLDARLEGLGRWPSFPDWARCETGADLAAQEPGPVTPLDYWWLAGATSESGAVHALPVYPSDHGLYVPPDDGLIRVYSCMMKASVAEAAYSAALGVGIKSSPLPCLGCLMGGAAQLLGRETVKGALLDERWRIEFAVCAEHGPEMPAHFSVFDGDEAYDLVGCADDGTLPVWIRHEWDDSSPHEITAWA